MYKQTFASGHSQRRQGICRYAHATEQRQTSNSTLRRRKKADAHYGQGVLVAVARKQSSKSPASVARVKSRKRSRSATKSQTRNRRTPKSRSGHSNAERQVAAAEGQHTAGQYCKHSEMSSIHNLARKASFKKLSKQRSDVTGYFPLRRSSQDGPEQLEELHTAPKYVPYTYNRGTVKGAQQSFKNTTSKSPASAGLARSSPGKGIERLTRLKRSVLNGPQPNLLTNELRKYLNHKTSPGPAPKSKSKSSRSASRSRSRSACRYAIVNGQKTRMTFNTDLPKTPTTAVHSSMLNGSHSQKIASHQKGKGVQQPEQRVRKKSRSKSKRYKLLVPKFQPRRPIDAPGHRATAKNLLRAKSSNPYSLPLSRNAARSHSRSISKVSVRSDNCYHTSTRCLSINFPNKSDHMGRRASNTPTAFGQAVVNGATGGARVEQVMLSPPEYSLEYDRLQAMNRSKNCSSIKAKKRLKASSKSKSKKRTASKSKSQRRIRQGKIVDGGSVPLRRQRQAQIIGQAVFEKPRTRALSTTFGTRHMKKLLASQGPQPQAEPGIPLSTAEASKRQTQEQSKSKSKRKVKSHGPVTQWMNLMTSGSLKKSNPELKMKKLAKANRKSRSHSREERSKSMKKRRNEKLEQARKNIKARMFEQQQALEKCNGLGMPQPPHLDEQAVPPYQDFSMDDGLGGVANKYSEPNMAPTSTSQMQREYSGELVDDYQHALLQETNANTQHLGSSLGLDVQPYQHPFTTAPRLRTESSQRTLSVENYQINEERASKGPKRQSSQVTQVAGGLLKGSERGNGEAGRRRASCSAASSINYSETLDNEIIAQQMNGQLLTMPTKYFYNQQSIPSDTMMQGPEQRTPEQKSTRSLRRKCSRSLTKTKGKKESACQSAASPKSRGSRSRNVVPRTQSRLSRKKENSTGKRKSRKCSRHSAKTKSRSRSNRSGSRSLKRSSSNIRLKSRQASRQAAPMHTVHSPGSSSALVHLQQQSGIYDQHFTRSSQPPQRGSDFLRTQSRLSGQPTNCLPSDVPAQHHSRQPVGHQTFYAHSEINQDEAAANQLQTQALQLLQKSERTPQEGRLHRKHLETMYNSKKDLHHSDSPAYEVIIHQKYLNQTERREKRLQIEGLDEEKPLLEGKAAREEIRELNFRQENRLAALKESLKQNLEEIKETQKQLRTGVAKDEEASSEAREKRGGTGRRRQPKTFAEQVNRYSDRIDAMIEERFEREVTKIKDRRLKLQILKNRAEREAKEQEERDPAAATPALSRHESREETVATERERQADIEELIRLKQEEIEGLQKQKLLKRLSEQVENELQNFDAAKLERMSVACSAVDLQKLQSENADVAESLRTTGARPRLTQSNVQFSAENGKSSARRSNGSARRSDRKSVRQTERNSETKSGRRSGRSAHKQRGKHEWRKKTHASRTGSLDSGKASSKSGKRKRSMQKKSRHTTWKKSPSRTTQFQPADNEQLIIKRSKRLRSSHSKNPSRNQPYKTEVMNSKNSTIVHQCKASAGSDRPTPELGPDDPYGGSGPCDVLQDRHASYQTQSHGIQDQAKRLRFSMDRGAETASAVNGTEVISARGSAFASARSGMPFNIQTAQGMTGSGPGYGPSGPGLIYNNLIKINKDSGIFENFGSCSITVDNGPTGGKDCPSRPKNQHNSILKNFSAKLGHSQASLERSCSHEELNSHIGSVRSQRACAAPVTGVYENGGGSIAQDPHQSASNTRDHQSHGKADSPTAQPSSDQEKPQASAPSAGGDDSDDSDSDIEFKFGTRAAFIDKVQRVVRGHRGAKDRHLPKWQRLAINQIRV